MKPAERLHERRLLLLAILLVLVLIRFPLFLQQHLKKEGDFSQSRTSLVLRRLILGYLEKGIQTPRAQGRLNEIISMIKWTRTRRLSIKISLSLQQHLPRDVVPRNAKHDGPDHPPQPHRRRNVPLAPLAPPARHGPPLLEVGKVGLGFGVWGLGFWVRGSGSGV